MFFFCQTIQNLLWLIVTAVLNGVMTRKNQVMRMQVLEKLMMFKTNIGQYTGCWSEQAKVLKLQNNLRSINTNKVKHEELKKMQGTCCNAVTNRTG